MLFYLIAFVVFGFLAAIATELTGGSVENEDWGAASSFIFVPFVIFFLGGIIPMIALTVRRFHDLGQTGWLVLVFNILGLIPLIGALIGLCQIIWFCFPGTKGANAYGLDPLSTHTWVVFD